MIRLGILLSGRGSNFVAIAKAIECGRLPAVEIGLVVTNRENAEGYEVARTMGLPVLCVPSAGRKRGEQEAEVIAALHQAGIHLVCLAGYMRVLTPAFLAAFPGAILNIHPSLLPSFAGLEVQKAALEYGVKVTGCTVHFVDEAVDRGVIVLQRTVEVVDDDTTETLAERILVEEHVAYPEAILRVVSGRYTVVGRRYVLTR